MGDPNKRARGNADSLFDTSKGITSTASNRSDTTFNSLFPQYSKDVTNPTGFGAGDLSAINTAGQESTAGGVAAAEGKAKLGAARTRNLGASQGVTDDAARTAIQQNSKNAVDTMVKNAQLKQQQRSQGLAGLSNLNSTSVDELLKSMNIGNEAIGNEIKAAKPTFMQNFTGLLGSLGQLGQGVGAAAKGF